MRKLFTLSLLLLLVSQFIKAQTTVTVTGTVKNNNGNYLHFAFVQDKQFKYATYSDSTGSFTLTANPNSMLSVGCAGYKDTTFKINNKTNFNLVLYPNGDVAAKTVAAPDESQSRSQALQDAFNPTSSTSGDNFNYAQGSLIPQISHKEQTEGTRYLYTTWVHGFVINSKDSIVQNNKFLFNYDKIGGGLLLTQDKVSAIEINRGLVKSFTIYDQTNVPRMFENVPDLDQKHYVEVLASGKKYKIYKTIKTKFVKADYATNGISSTGNNFDSYQDTYEYYVLNLQNNAKEKLELKKKSIKTNFAAEADKVNKFTNDHSSDPIDDSYLSNLGSYMNE